MRGEKLECRRETRDGREARGETHLREKPSLVYRAGEKHGAYVGNMPDECVRPQVPGRLWELIGDAFALC